MFSIIQRASAEDNRRLGSVAMATKARGNRSISASMLATSNTGCQIRRGGQLVSRRGLHCQRIMDVFPAAEFGNRQPLVTGRPMSWRFDRVVFEHEQRVEQLVVAGETVDLTERQMLVVEGLIVGAV